MDFEEIFITSTKALKANKLRSILTMLGVIIGVFAVVSLVSLGKGLENYITDEFNELGSNLLFIVPGKVSSSGFGDDPANSLTRNKLEEKHVDLINTYASEHLVDVSPYLIIGETTEYKTKSIFAEITGVSASAIEMINYEIDIGRGFSKGEERSGEEVAIIGPEVQKELFGAQNSIGKRIKIGSDSYEVIGTFKEKGSNYDDQIIVPYTAAEQSFDLKTYSSLFAKVTDQESVDIAMRQIEFALSRDLDEDDFSVLSQKDFLDSIQSILGVLTAALSAIAGISLLVGGIGIMNIMLVSVTERIKEIGLRKAIGADPTSIALQFLVEATLISVIGGAIGLFLGWMTTLAVQSFLRAEIPLYTVILAFVFSVAVGVIFGTYPAINASKKDPMEALRYE